jgi:pterin-4a-carbinolamine dehydratase
MEQKTQQKSSSTAGTVQARRPSSPTAGLKAERVQFQAERFSERLKAERVQERLKSMPGWRLAAGGKSLDRVRRFPNPRTAASFTAFLAHFVVGSGQLVGVELSGNHVAITLRPRNRGGLTEGTLDFAQALG